jgi:hypothetical protein
MNPVLLLAVGVTVCFCLSKFAEMRFLCDEEDMIPLKQVTRDALVVFCSTLSASFLYFYFQTSIADFFNVLTETKVLTAEKTQIFTDVPPF